MRRRTGGTLDPFSFNPLPNAVSYGPTNVDTGGRALRATQTLSSAVKNLVLITDGQSNHSNVGTTAYVPANPTKIDNFNLYDGALYAAIDPLLGCSLFGLGNPALRVADTLITNGKFDRVVIPSIAIGGTSSTEHATGFLKNRVPDTLRRLAARGIVEGTNVTIIVWLGQGETDRGGIALGLPEYSPAILAANYATYIANIRAAGLATGRIFINKQTYNVGSVLAALQTAQWSVVNHGANVWEGANADALIGTACGGVACRVGVSPGDVHFSDAGCASLAAAAVTAFAASGAPF